MLGSEAGNFLRNLRAVAGVVFDLLNLVTFLGYQPRSFTGKIALALTLLFDSGFCCITKFVETAHLFA